MNALVLVVMMVAIAAAIARWRSRMSVGFQVAFLMRAQVLLIASPLLIAIAAAEMPEMFGNLVILEHPNRDAFYVAFVAFASAWMSLALITIVLDHAQERFDVVFAVPHWFWAASGYLFAIPPALLMARIYFASGGRGLIGMALGLVAALIVVGIVDFVFHLLDPAPALTGRPLRRFAFAGGDYPEAVRRANPLTRLPRLMFTPLRWFGPGYVWPTGGPHAPPDHALVGLPYPEHFAAAVAVVIGAIFWIASFYSGWTRLTEGYGTTGIPVLAYLELLILLVTLIVSGASFCLDRYRIPVLAALFIYVIVSSRMFDTDHYWLATASPKITNTSIPVTESAQALATANGPGIAAGPRGNGFSDGIGAWLAKYSTPSPSDVLRIDGKPVVVVVCAAGGGIEAGAWTDVVLQGLQREFHEPFTRSIRVVSSTSGGTVGSLFFIHSFLENRNAPSDSRWDAIVNASMTGSLDATGWGLAHPDFVRLMAPGLGPVWRAFTSGQSPLEADRGWAIEQAWRVALSDGASRASINSDLSTWRSAVGDPAVLLPGTIFNATIVETGNPLLFSSISIPLPIADSPVLVFGQNIDPGADISNVTAARLSATFPYVSPVARGLYRGRDDPRWPINGNHVADGGYYDNYGFTAAAEWITFVARNSSYRSNIAKIIVIAIDAFPEVSLGQSVEQAAVRGGWLSPKSGWGSEVLGPIKAALNARGATQLGHDSIEAMLLQNLDYLNLQADPAASQPNPACPHLVNIFPMVPGKDANESKRVRPLSWQLSPAERDAIRNDWNNPAVQKSRRLLHQCLAE